MHVSLMLIYIVIFVRLLYVEFRYNFTCCWK